MYSCNQQGASSSNFDMSSDKFIPEPWEVIAKSDQIINTVPKMDGQSQISQWPQENTQPTWQPVTEASVMGQNYEQNEYLYDRVNTEQQNLMHHTSMQQSVNGYQSFYNSFTCSQANPSIQFQTSLSPQQQISKPCVTSNCNIASSHHGRISLVASTSGGGFKAILKRKRKRTMFTTEQIDTLEAFFKTKPYISREERQVLVEELQVGDSAIKVWFQNRRLRGKREAEQANLDVHSPSSEESFYKSPKKIRFDYIESEINKKTDEFGYVTLDDKAIEEIVNVIDTVLSDNIELDLLFNEDDKATITAKSETIVESYVTVKSDVTAESSSIAENDRTTESDVTAVSHFTAVNGSTATSDITTESDDTTESNVTVKSNVTVESDVSTENDLTPESDTSTYTSIIYEPISPASDCVDDKPPRWEPFAPEQSLQRLFDLHFC